MAATLDTGLRLLEVTIRPSTESAANYHATIKAEQLVGFDLTPFTAEVEIPEAASAGSVEDAEIAAVNAAAPL